MPEAKPKPRWHRFGLAFLLMAVSIVCVVVGKYILLAKAQKNTVDKIVASGGGVVYGPLEELSKEENNQGTPIDKNYTRQVSTVNFNRHDISELPDLSGVPRLKNLWIPETNISDLSPIKELKHLEQLWITQTRVTDLTPAKHCRNLEWVNLKQTDVTDLSPLYDLPKLKTLVFSGKRFTEKQIELFRQHQPKCKLVGLNSD